MTTLPIYWPESSGVDDLLKDGGETGWVRPALERDFTIRPLDTLDADTLAEFDLLMLAQPRALAPDENVALDDWIRAGGRLLLFADPMLTAHSRFRIGDRRRPQDVALLSPILSHWGLELTFDADQSPEESVVDFDGIPIPVSLSGRWSQAENGSCELAGEGAIATCAIGEGRVLILADAAVLEEAPVEDPTRQKALVALTGRAFR